MREGLYSRRTDGLISDLIKFRSSSRKQICFYRSTMIVIDKTLKRSHDSTKSGYTLTDLLGNVNP